jgi:hypothetical protein
MTEKEEQKLIEDNPYFEDEFIEELDSWFSADICCCDDCYDEFLKNWPRANNDAFQRAALPLDCFYSGSRIHSNLTEDECMVLIKNIECPRCGNPLTGNIWLYDLPFLYDIDTTDFEKKIEELYNFSKRTPFLLLDNPYAKEIYELLKKTSKDTTPYLLNQTLFRARIAEQVDKLILSEFGVAPKRVISEGRYNHAGEQVLYLGSDINTCYNEIGENSCYVIECNVNRAIKVLDLSKPDESHDEYESELNALAYSALISRKTTSEGWDKPEYVFSRFLYDCAKASGFDAIKYPSTKSITDNFNLVIINEDIFQNNIDFNDVYFFNGKLKLKKSILSN